MPDPSGHTPHSLAATTHKDAEEPHKFVASHMPHQGDSAYMKHVDNGKGGERTMLETYDTVTGWNIHPHVSMVKKG